MRLQLLILAGACLTSSVVVAQTAAKPAPGRPAPPPIKITADQVPGILRQLPKYTKMPPDVVARQYGADPSASFQKFRGLLPALQKLDPEFSGIVNEDPNEVAQVPGRGNFLILSGHQSTAEANQAVAIVIDIGGKKEILLKDAGLAWLQYGAADPMMSALALDAAGETGKKPAAPAKPAAPPQKATSVKSLEYGGPLTPAELRAIGQKEADPGDRVARTDLNGDGKLDLVILGSYGGPRGSTVDTCAVFLSSAKGYKSVLEEEFHDQVGLGSGTTHGVKDLVLDGERWAFDGAKYHVVLTKPAKASRTK